MKWIGQHIWDFVSRFRGDVYIENLSTTTETNVLVIDSNDKVSKNTIEDLHHDTSSQASVDNSGSTYIQDVTLDTYGHVTGLASAAIPTLNQDTTGQAGTVATIAGLAPNTATTQAAQPNITSVGTLTNLDVDNININGDTITASADLSIVATGNDIAIDTDNLVIESATDGKPFVELKSTTNSSNGSVLQFTSDKGAAGVDNDTIGSILFVGDDDHPTQQQTNYAKIIGKVSDASNTDEAGKLEFQVAESDGTTTTLTTGLLIEGEHATDGEVDVTIGAGAASVTTIAGTLAMGSTTAEKVASGQHIHKQVKVTLSQANCNALAITPIELIPAQGADTIIVPGSGIMMVDNNTSVDQANTAADLNFHYADKEPGSYLTTSLFHIRRFMVGNNSTDIVYSLGELTGFEISQNLTDCVNKAVEVSVDSALTNNSMTSITIYLSYYVIDIS